VIDSNQKSSMRNVKIIGNKGDGVRIGKGASIDIDGLEIADNGGIGLNILDNAKKSGGNSDSSRNTANHWYKKPIGILGLTVIGGLLVIAAHWAFQHYFSLLIANN
jgi:hypothetical protein